MVAIKLTMVSIKRGTVRHTFFVHARYVNGKATIPLEIYSALIAKTGWAGQRITFGA